MNSSDAAGSMKPLDIQDLDADSSTTPYQLSEGDRGLGGLGSPASFKARSVAYLTSNNGKELAFCGIFGFFTYFIGYVWKTPNQRNIPYQYLYESGTYVLNLVNNEEYVESTVPELPLGIVILLCPCLQLICSHLHGYSGDLHKTLCVYLLSIPVNELATWTIKVYVGYLRPNFYSLCQPSDDYQYCTDDQEWQDGRMSFPSGHASYAFCALTLLHLYLEHCLGFSRVATQLMVLAPNEANSAGKQVVNPKLVLLPEPENALKYRIVSILCLIPIGLAIFIACSRVRDNKHFPADIVAGGILGASIARYFHFLWFREPRMVQL